MKYNHEVELFRDEEYPMMKDKVYLDHGGTTIYCKSLIDAFSQKLLSNLYGNPHSNSDPARLSSEVVETTREAALRFFGADPEHFDLVFTANATAAIKLVGDCFLDLASSDTKRGAFFYGYHRDAHTSLVGIRELTGGTHHCFSSDRDVEDWLNDRHIVSKDLEMRGMPGLFAYPGQSNMTGRRLPLSWPAQLRASPKHQHIYSLLDAAALSTTTQLDLSDPDTAPDFTALSFYKIFGFPDLGALIVRKKSGHILKWRRYFGGGTITMLTVHDHASVQRREVLHEALEEGTLPFHSIIALGCAIDVHKRLYGSMTTISQHTSFLAQRLYRGLSQLKHHNGRELCVIYNDSDTHEPYSNSETQGGTIAFNVLRENGSYVDYSQVETLANEVGIFVRSGGLCNAGGIAHYLQIQPWQWKRNWSAGFRCGAGEGMEVINDQPTGVVRASLGAMSTISDVDIFVDFMASTFLNRPGSAVISEGVVSNASKSTAISQVERWVESNNTNGSSESTSGSPAVSVFEPTAKVQAGRFSTDFTARANRRLTSRVSLDEVSNIFRHRGQPAGLAPGGLVPRNESQNVQSIAENDFRNPSSQLPNRSPTAQHLPLSGVDGNARPHTRTRGLTSHQSQSALGSNSVIYATNPEQKSRSLLRSTSRFKSWVSGRPGEK